MTNLAVKLAETVRSFGVGSVYGEPVDIEGQTIVPVALAYYGFGGGSEESSNDDDSAAGGGGGGGLTVPIGAYVKGEDGRVGFQPNFITLLAVSIPVICVTGKALSRIIRALKK